MSEDDYINRFVHDKVVNELEQENARLKAEVERLEKPAVMGGYNISEYIRMANSETLEFDNGDMFADMTLPERIKYIVKSHARLQAEVVLWEDYARLAAEVERLEPELEQRCRELNLSLAQQAIQLRQIGELKAEVERLHKELADAQENYHIVNEMVAKMLKEGKPSV